MSSQEPLARGLGMPDGAADVYAVLLDGAATTIPEIAEATGLDSRCVVPLVEWLRDHGLALRAKGLEMTDPSPRWAAAEPDHAVRELVAERERALHEVRAALPDLQYRFRTAQQGDGGTAIEHIEGWQNIGNRYHQILREASTEVAVWEHEPYMPGHAPVEESILERGVRFRVLCDPVDFPDQLAQEFLALRGLEARLGAGVAFRGVLVDRRTALVTMDREAQNHAAVVVHPSPLLDGLAFLFDAAWSQAVPLGNEGISLPASERQVLTLLAAGLKDEAIARQQSTTTRTVRRRVQAVLTALGARSRFHAGVEANRRGWV
ncbi:LuxR C-terminal-related transcriptional regulator [Promicromonospora sp. NPDC052451]|uniref:LuxR C-terminal-related transcriptional regulator n=1 Tax=unclassified Promicromonospora TaxID=2647929 RepID=UPI0037C9E3E8